MPLLDLCLYSFNILRHLIFLTEVLPAGSIPHLCLNNINGCQIGKVSVQ